MKSMWREIIMAVIMGMILPGITLNWAVEDRENPTPEETQFRPVEPQQTMPLKRMEMRLRRSDGSVESMDLEDYLVGVVLAELPSNFELEAKKAQAVAARTYVCRAMETGGKHGDGSVCAEPGCCQAWFSEEEYLEMGGSQSAVEQARRAVDGTCGYVLTYEGKLIEATYFSCSGGLTEDTVAVWGTDVPYLRSVESPGEENAAHYTDTVYFTGEEFADRLGLSLTGSPETWFGQIHYTSGGGVDTVTIGGVVCTGTILRSKLGLYSTVFTLKPDEKGVTITTRGFGHRVGMSQYGAEAMAVSGSSYAEILAHYYRGTTLELTNVPG